MEKLSITIDPEQWGNLVTKYQPHSPRLDNADFTAGTVNLDTDTNGSLSKRKGGVNYNATPLATPIKDQYEAIFSDGTRHLLVVANGEIKYSSGDTIFNTIVNGTGYSTGGNFEFATTQDRVYGGNAINSPIVYDRVTNYGGATYTAPRIKTMGAQSPGSAPTGSVVAGGAVPIGGHTYKVTFIYYDAEESVGSPASSLLTTTSGNQHVNLTIPLGGYGVTQRNIYRDNNDGNWVLVGNISDNTTTAFADTIAVYATPLPIPTIQMTPPSFGLIKLWLDRLWLAQVPGDPNTLFYSDASLPDVFDPENQVLCNPEDPITALAVYFDRLIVFNRRSMGQIIGDTPEQFRYAAIPSSVGCVDNRTLQTHVLKGVPVLIWLSERGFYTYDGNAIDYISDPIEDLVTYNIRQAIQQKNSNSQTSFTGGTASNGLDLSLLASSISTRGYSEGTSLVGNNPRRNWDETLDWNGGSAKNNVIIADGSNLIKGVTKFEPAVDTGTLSNAIISGSDIQLQTVPDFTGQNYSYNGPCPSIAGQPTAIADRITPSKSGVMTSFSWMVIGASGGFTLNSVTGFLKVWTDSGGIPGTQLASYPVTYVRNINGANLPFTTVTTSVPMTGGVSYWVGFEMTTSGYLVQSAGHPYAPTGLYKRVGGVWSQAFDQQGTGRRSAWIYTYNSSAISKSGSWTSPIYDTLSDYVSSGINAYLSATYPSGSYPSGPYTTSSIVRIEASNDINMVSGLVFEDINSLSGFSLLSLSSKRYWRIRITLSTTDDRVTPTVNTPLLKFNLASDWTSESIDVTSDVTALNSLVTVETIPSGTSVVYKIATSSDDITYPDGFVTFGTQVNRRYVKVKVFLTTTSSNATTPSIESIVLRWTVQANYISPIIDTAVTPPAGWDIFLAQFSPNGGTVQFQMRSAASSGGIPSATFYTIVPGEFPVASVTPLQYVQWKAILTSSDNQVPIVDSVTTQWFIAIAASVRPASIFDNGRYYVALAELNQTNNNLVLQLDLNGKWRRFGGIQVATMSFFFNRPYIGLSDAGQIRKFLEGYQDGTNNIALDVRTKAFDCNTQYRDVSEKKKIVGEVYLHAKNTGAAIYVYYSVDDGATFFPLYTNDGVGYYQTNTNGDDFWIRMKPDWNAGNPIAGSHIMYRIYNNDQYSVEIHAIKIVAMVRKQPPVITG